MGDIGSPRLPAAQTLPFETKLSPAEHVENTSQDLNDRPIKRQRSHGSQNRPTISTATSETKPPVDSKMGSSNPSPTSQAFPDTTAKDWNPPAPEDYRPPTPIREFPHFPKCWVDYEPPTSASEAVSKWIEKFVPVLYEYYKDWPAEKRITEFDALFAYDQDRYRNVIVRFYADHPDLIPERPLGDFAAKFINARWNETPARVSKKRIVFNDWDWPSGPATNVPEPSVGPMGESFPGEEVECEHCAKQAKLAKFKDFGRSVVKPMRNVRRKFSLHHEAKPMPEQEPKDVVVSGSSESSSASEIEEAKRREEVGSGGSGGAPPRRWAIRPRISTQVERHAVPPAVKV